MARVTVEDCVVKVPNRFKLVMMAAQRSRTLSVGVEPTLDRDNDKNPVVALREIAEETVALGEVENALISGLQRHTDVDELVEDDQLAITNALHEEFAKLADAGEIVKPPVQEEHEVSGEEDEVPGEEDVTGWAAFEGGFQDVDPEEIADED